MIEPEVELVVVGEVGGVAEVGEAAGVAEVGELVGGEVAGAKQ